MEGAMLEDVRVEATVDGVATVGDHRYAWFKDPDLNVIGIHDELRAAQAVGRSARSARTCSKMATISGSNCVPPHRRSSPSAWSIVMAGA
jgi:hypothetical protein